MPIKIALYAALLTLALAACSSGPSREDVIAQARPDGGAIAFDVVKIDDAVLATLQAQRPPAFRERFKKYLPPPDLKVAVGDTVSVVIWEATADGLFGNSLTESSSEAGAVQGATAAPSLSGTAESAGADVGRSPIPGYGSLTAATALDEQRQPGAPPNGTERQLEAPVDLAVQGGRPGTRIPDQQVGPDGAISIPYAGRVKVAGRTPVEVQRTIEKLLGKKAIEPQVMVFVKRSLANSVSVAGEVIRGKRVELSPGGDRLLQVIAAAGGAKAPVHETFVRLSRGRVTATLPLAALVADPDQDIFVEPGDVLTLVRRAQTFSVFGATGKNAAITFDIDHLSLSEALAKAGGLLDDRADPRAVFLFRYEPVGLVRALGQPIASGARDGLSPMVYRLDLSEAKSHLLARRFPVRDKDIIFVANAEIRPIYRTIQALSQITGPVETGFITCHVAGC